MVEVSIEFCIGRDFSSEIFWVQVPLQNLLDLFFEIMFGRYILSDILGRNVILTNFLIEAFRNF